MPWASKVNLIVTDIVDFIDVQDNVEQFLYQCAHSESFFSLTPLADPTAYGACFYLFNTHLIQRVRVAPGNIVSLLRNTLRAQRAEDSSVPIDKPYRQLLTFTLSALNISGALSSDPMDDLVLEQLPRDVEAELGALGCFDGKAGSGNQAMFMAVFLIHARDWLGIDTQSQLDEWVDLHLHHMNRFGFWGPDRGMTHLQFQNGYHQHEILEYLSIPNPRQAEMVEAVRSLADEEGRFAPYPGGGGCYDYDAVFLLTPEGRIPDPATRELLLKTARSILASQNEDGGFCESQYIRPRSLTNTLRFIRHVASARGNLPLIKERLRYALTLQRPRHDRIHTHWSQYSRRWNESDLWDTWFRMLALARIDVALNPRNAERWGFIDYPGIGFHPACRAKDEREGA